MLFSERSIWTMVHGIGLGGGALIGLAAAFFYLSAARSADHVTAPPGSGALAGATVLSAVLLWLTVIVGTYVIFPPYRATPPPGVTDLSEFPRAHGKRMQPGRTRARQDELRAGSRGRPSSPRPDGRHVDHRGRRLLPAGRDAGRRRARARPDTGSWC